MERRKNPIATRRIDELGRLVIPLEARKSLGWGQKDYIDVYRSKKKGTLILKKSSRCLLPQCIICGNTNSEILLTFSENKRICRDCVRRAVATVEQRETNNQIRQQCPIRIDTDFIGKLWNYTVDNGIYSLCGSKNSAYAVPIDYKGHLLAEKELKYGMEIDGVLYFPFETTGIIIQQKLLNEALKDAEKTVLYDSVKLKLSECRANGEIAIPEYFGETNAPGQVPEGKVKYTVRICNGIHYCYCDGDNEYLAVSADIAEVHISKLGHAIGKRIKDYLFFNKDWCVVALYELMEDFKEIRDMIPSKDKLLSKIHKECKSYVEALKSDAPNYQVPEPQTHYTDFDPVYIVPEITTVHE